MCRVQPIKTKTVLLDTKGPEIRSGFFDTSVMKKLELRKGQELILTGDYSYKAVDATKLACSYDQMAEDVKEGQEILVADGSLVLKVLSCNVATKEVTCEVLNNCSLGERKNMNLPGVKVSLPTFTEKDVDDIVNFGIKNGVEFIAASFVRTGQDVQNLRKLLVDNDGAGIKIVSKIENQEGLENYDEILKETDGVMVARGDVSSSNRMSSAQHNWTKMDHSYRIFRNLTQNSIHCFPALLCCSQSILTNLTIRIHAQLGMEIPPSKVFLAQKFMIRKANIAGKPVITATQMLESMINNPRPTRAECSDVANAVYDGTDAVMLSGESANSPYFEQAVHIMSRTVVNAEQTQNYNFLYQAIRNSVVIERGPLSTGESVASSAVSTVIDIDAKLIVILSDTGKMAGYVSKFRPSVSSLILTPSTTVARQSSGLMLGMHSILVDSLEKSEELIEETMYELSQNSMMKTGDKIIFMAGRASSIKERLMIKPLNEGKSHGRFVKNGGMFFNRGLLLSYGTYEGI